MGASGRHPLGSSLTARAAEGPRLRTALSVYNFSGDIGKMALPALTAAPRRAVAMALAPSCSGLTGWSRGGGSTCCCAAWWPAASRRPRSPRMLRQPTSRRIARRATAFSPSPRSASSMPEPATGSSPPALPACRQGRPTCRHRLRSDHWIFAGGATGKFLCGVLATRLGILRSVTPRNAATSIGHNPPPAAAAGIRASSSCR